MTENRTAATTLEGVQFEYDSAYTAWRAASKKCVELQKAGHTYGPNMSAELEDASAVTKDAMNVLAAITNQLVALKREAGLI